MDVWLTAAQVAPRLGMKREAVARDLKNETVKGHPVVVRKVHAKGCRGFRYEVLESSIASLSPSSGTTANAVAVAPSCVDGCGAKDIPYLPPADNHELQFRLDITSEVFRRTRRRTAERRALIAEMSMTRVSPSGMRPSISTINRWMTRYRKLGVEGLMKQPRKDRGIRRTIFSRKYDAEARALVSEKTLNDFAEAVRVEINSMHASRSCKRPVLQRLLVARLKAFLMEHGSTLPEPELIRLSELPTLEFFAPDVGVDLLSIKSTDASTYVEKVRPSILRHIDGLRPMQLVALDVNHMDVLYRRNDGTNATAKIIAGLCVATKRLVLAKVVPLEAGRGITRANVMPAVAEMFNTAGVPESIYCDNGPEFGAIDLVQDMSRLRQTMNLPILNVKAFDDLDRTLIHSRPHIAQGKFIESTFSAIRSLFALSSGYVAGNRLKAKSANLGRAPVPYDGTIEQLIAMVETVVNLYHCKPQGKRSHLKGLSPNEAYTRWLDDGYRPVLADMRNLQIAFAIEETRVVGKSGRISWKSRRDPREPAQFYRSDDLQIYTKRTVRVREPLVGPKHILYVFDLEGKSIAVAQPELIYRAIDPEGAREQARRESHLKKQLAGIKRGTVVVDYEKTMRDTVAAHGTPPTPEPAAIITCGGEYAVAANRADEAIMIDDGTFRRAIEDDRRRKQSEALDKFEELRKRNQSG